MGHILLTCNLEHLWRKSVTHHLFIAVTVDDDNVCVLHVSIVPQVVRLCKRGGLEIIHFFLVPTFQGLTLRGDSDRV